MNWEQIHCEQLAVQSVDMCLEARGVNSSAMRNSQRGTAKYVSGQMEERARVEYKGEQG